MILKTKFSFFTQLALSLGTVILISALSYFFRQTIDYPITALTLLSTVSLFAVLFDILPVLITCISSAFILNFFLIPPYFTLHISNSNDILLFSIFLAVALVNSILTYKIRNTEKLARLKEEKEKEIKLYNTLFNSLSHELRTPLATIMASADNLLNEQETLDKEVRQILTEQIAIAGKRLNEQVGHLLSMSRMESGMLQPKKEWCDLEELVQDSINRLDNQHHKFSISTMEHFPLILIDTGLLQEILTNIFRNAIVYTPAGTKVHITYKLIDESILHCSIADNGPGVNENELPYLFDKFYRSNQHIKGGTGLGLSIVKGYTEALNGTISVIRNHEGGLTFDLQLPVETSYINNLNIE